jgi:serine/threonine protein kinase
MPRKRPKLLKKIEPGAPRRPTRGRRRPHTVPPTLSDEACQAVDQQAAALGAGSFGVVRLGRHGDKTVAVKTFNDDFDLREVVLQNAAAEVARGVAKVIGMCPKEKMVLMEALQGNPGELSARRVVEVAEQLFTALYHMHSAGVYHGDISKPNIVFDGGGDPKFIDFGMACDSEELCAIVEGRKLGNEIYFPPEWGFLNVPTAALWGVPRRQAEEKCFDEDNLQACIDKVAQDYGMMKKFMPSAEKRAAAKDVWALGKVLSILAGLATFPDESAAAMYADRADELEHKPSFPTEEEVAWAMIWPPNNQAPELMVTPRADMAWPKVAAMIKTAMHPNPLRRPTAEKMLDIIDKVKWF